MDNRDEEIKLLAEYLLRLLNEKEADKEIKQTPETPQLSRAEIAAQKTMRELNETHGVEADVIRRIIKRANELRPNKQDYTTRWDKPLWEEGNNLFD